MRAHTMRHYKYSCTSIINEKKEKSKCFLCKNKDGNAKTSPSKDIFLAFLEKLPYKGII